MFDKKVEMIHRLQDELEMTSQMQTEHATALLEKPRRVVGGVHVCTDREREYFLELRNHFGITSESGTPFVMRVDGVHH